MSYGLDNLPYASVLGSDGRRFAAVRFGDAVLDLARVDPTLFANGTLDVFLAAGPDVWSHVRAAARSLLETGAVPLTPLAGVRPVLGFAVADYVDFYASEHHATNAGRIFRPNGEALGANWKVFPVGYHGRAGTIVASDTPIARPAGHLDATTFAPTRRLDFEAEIAFVVGAPSSPGMPVGVDDADRHVFGVCVLNDWSARDVQRYEAQPLGPFLGKSFATSVSAWITPLEALAGVRVPVIQDPVPLPHLRGTRGPYGLDVALEIRINGTLVSSPGFADMYWTYAQLVAHLTSNGSALRAGDVLGSGTVSGPERRQRGCLLELTWNGDEPIVLDDGSTRMWLIDGDEVVIGARAGSLTLGEARGRIVSNRAGSA